MLTALVQSAGLHLDPEGVPIAPAGIPPRLVLVLAEASGAPHLLINGDEPLERELRRWAVLGGRDTATDGGDDALIRVLSVLGLPDGEALDRVDRLVLDLRPHDVAVVVGASSVLCDALRPAAERLRAGTLRLGRLSVALRLPRGLWRHAHRQALGVWVCEGGRNFLHPLIADLSADAPAEIAVGDLAADVSAALVDGRGRAFRYLRPVELATVLAGGPLVPEGARAPRPREAVGHDYLDRAQSAALVVAEPLPALHVFVTASPGAVLQRRRSLGELHEGPGVTVINGRVIGPEHTMPGGSVRVLSADGPVDGLTLDPLDVDRLYPRASRTEPNDVVFVDGARPRAWVDADGGALVASPARILRLRPPVSCGPHTLAAIINTRSRPGEWRTWEIPLLDSGAAAALDAAVAEIAVHDIRLRTRQTALRELTIALLDGVTAGAIDVVPRIADQEGPAT
ncbi:hypothetical protein [Cryptosporangium sp. NPDC048952]|uniref:hypothetical protein n=1 Tax=Cryptosporangium sp. NPDC048952 TaxID=3363961 RepID=UPI0037249392